MTPLHVGTNYTHNFRFYNKGNASGIHQSASTGSLEPQFAWAARGLHPLRTPINEGKRPLKFLPQSLFRPKGGRKTINFLDKIRGLVPHTNCKHLESYIMLGTHSKPCRGEMSHICDISLLRVNEYQLCYINCTFTQNMIQSIYFV